MRHARLFLGWLGTVELVVAVTAFVLVVVLSALQIVLRSVFNTSIIWVQEVAQLGMLISYFIGAAYLYKQRQYMLVEFFVEKLRPRAQMILYLVAQALTFLFAVIMVVQIIEIAPAQLRMRTFLLRLPRFYSSLPVLIGSVSLALLSVYYAVAALQAGAFGGAVISIPELEAQAKPQTSDFERPVVT